LVLGSFVIFGLECLESLEGFFERAERLFVARENDWIRELRVVWLGLKLSHVRHEFLIEPTFAKDVEVSDSLDLIDVCDLYRENQYLSKSADIVGPLMVASLRSTKEEVTNKEVSLELTSGCILGCGHGEMMMMYDESQNQ
jgi:hypothetical protein